MLHEGKVKWTNKSVCFVCTWTHFLVGGVGCGTAGVANLSGINAFLAPKLSLCPPEAAHPCGTPTAHTHTHKNMEKKKYEETKKRPLWIYYCETMFTSRWKIFGSTLLTENNHLRVFWERRRGSVAVDVVFGWGRRCEDKTHTYSLIQTVLILQKFSHLFFAIFIFIIIHFRIIFFSYLYFNFSFEKYVIQI